MTPEETFRGFRWAERLFPALLFFFALPEALMAGESGGWSGEARGGFFQAAEEPTKDSAAATPRGPGAESALVLEKAIRSSQREAKVPVQFTAAAGETVGLIRAQVMVPPGPWRFRKLALPKGSRLKASAKEKKPVETSGETKTSGQTVIEFSFSSGSRAIPNGLIGYLQFSLSEPEAELPESLLLARLETFPPESEAEPVASSEDSLPLPAEPPLNPIQSCFFFSH